MQKTSLYRHFDSDGRLLYVGISLSAVARLAGHRQSHWHDAIARVEIEWHQSLKHAFYAEALAIRDEKPAHNLAKPMPARPLTEAEIKAESKSRRMREIKSGLFEPLPFTDGERTIVYTVLPIEAGAEAALKRIAKAVGSGRGYVDADVGRVGDGVIRVLRMAQIPGTRIVTDKPNAFRKAMHIFAERGLSLVPVKFKHGRMLPGTT